MQLVVKEVTLPEALEFNYEELKAELKAKVRDYMDVVYTDEMMKQAKADRSNLNKLKKTLNDERIRLEKEYLAPFQDFKAKISELCGIIDEAASCVDKQVKEYEQVQQGKKKEGIKKLFAEKMSPAFPWLALDRVFDPKWLNASVKMKQVEEALGNAAAKIASDMAMLSRLPEYSFEAMECYKSTLSVENALFQADNLKQLAEAKARAEAEAAAREAAPEGMREQAPDAPHAPVNGQDGQPEGAAGENLMTAEAPVNGSYEAGGQEPREWASFRAYLSYADAVALNQFFSMRNIRFEKI